jgi:hypothetical protein
MDRKKLDSLLNAARNDTPPAPGMEFDDLVMMAVRRDYRPEPLSLLDQLNSIFPRVALASVAVITFCILTEMGFATFTHSDLTTSVAEISEQWLFAVR